MSKKTLTLPSDWDTLPFSSYQNLTYFSRLNSNTTSSRKPSKPCRWSSYLFSLPSASWNCMDLLLLLSVPWNHKFLRQKSKLLPSSEEPLASSWGSSSREVLVNVCWGTLGKQDEEAGSWAWLGHSLAPSPLLSVSSTSLLKWEHWIRPTSPRVCSLELIWRW